MSNRPLIPPPPPNIPLAVKNGGLRQADLAAGAAPITVLVGPWLEWGKGDTAYIEWGSDPDREKVGFTIVQQTDPIQTVLILEADLPLLREGKHPVRVSVAPSGTPEAPLNSPDILIEVKRLAPGNGVLAAPTVVPDPVVGDLSGVEVIIGAYANTSSDDTIRAFWGSEELPIRPAPGSPPYRIPVPSDVIERAGPGNILVTYSVTDRVHNGPTSPATVVEVQIGRLAAPTIKEAPNGTLDPLAASAGATMVVPVSADLIAGDTLTTTFGSFTTIAQAATPGMSVLIPAAEVARCLGAIIAAFYTRTRAGLTLASEKMSLVVGNFQANDPRVKSPVFAEAGGSFVLDLKSFAGNATVSVTAWPLIAIGQRFWLRAIGSGVNWPIAESQIVSALGDFTRFLERSLLDTLADNATLSLQLAIAFDGGSSETLATTFLSQPYTIRAKATRPTFPPGAVLEAQNGTLPGDMPSATFRVPANAGLQTGESVTAYFAGTSLGFKTAVAGAVLDFPVSAGLIVANQGKSISCHYTVLRNGVEWPSADLALSVSTPPKEWDVEYGFDGVAFVEVGEGGQIQLPSVMDIHFHDIGSGPRENTIAVEWFQFSLPDYFEGEVLRIGKPDGTSHDNTVIIEFYETWSVVRLAVTSVDRRATFGFEDTDKKIFQTLTAPGDHPTVGHEIKCTAPPGKRIKYIRVYSNDVIRLDFFKFKR